MGVAEQTERRNEIYIPPPVTTKSWRDAESEDVEAGVKPGIKTLQKSKRVRKPNVRVNGPDWVRK
jgi:hypothetical protein